MRPIFLVSACGLALTALSACGPTTPATQRVALDCPSNQGELKLKGVAPDKKSCDYISEDGDQVQMRLIPVSTSYEAALQPIEQELQGEQADVAQTTAVKAADGKDAEARSADRHGADASASAMAGSSGASAAAKAAKQAADDARGAARQGDRDGDDGDKVSIGTNGITVGQNDGHGDHADINLPGLHISADDDQAKVNMGAVHVDAGEDGATVRVNREVRLRGEALSRQRHGFRATYILAKDNLKDGWKAVGYEAAGPKIGPVTVAVFRAREGRHVSDDVKRLVRRNGGI